MELNYLAAVFPSEEQIKKAVDDLLVGGFNRAQLGVIAKREDSPGTVDDAYAESVALTLDDDKQQIGVLVRSLSGTVAALAAGAVGAIATGGAAVPTIVAAAAGGAGVMKLGQASENELSREESGWIATQIGMGGAILFVTVNDDDHAAKAKAILANHEARMLAGDKKL